MYPVTLLLPARGYRVLGGYTGPLHAGGYRSGGYTLLLPGFCTMGLEVSDTKRMRARIGPAHSFSPPCSAHATDPCSRA